MIVRISSRREERSLERRMSGWRSLMSDVNYGISNVGTVMTSCAGTQHHIGQYHAKLERVKFGVGLEQVSCHDNNYLLKIN